MRRIATAAIAATALIAIGHRPAAAQDQGCSLLCAPAFVVQPGVLFTNVVSPPEIAGVKADAETNFQLRVVTIIPTSIPRLTLGVLGQLQPFNDAYNAVEFGFGAGLNVIPATSTGGIFSFDVVPIGAFSLAAQPDDTTPYTNKFIVEGNGYLHLGGLMGESAPALLKNMSLHTVIAYVATGFPDQADPWAIQAGLTIPLAPLPR